MAGPSTIAYFGLLPLDDVALSAIALPNNSRSPILSKLSTSSPLLSTNVCPTSLAAL